MKARFVYRRGAQVPDDVLALGNTPDSVFHAVYGRDYVVYAICIWTREVAGYVPRTEVLHYLIVDETQRPNWYPAPLFDVTDSRLPSDWHYAFWGQQAGYRIPAIWGYAEIVLDKGKHYTELTERDPNAMAIFNRRRGEIDRM